MFRIFALASLLAVGVFGQFPFGMFGFPEMFAGLRNIQSMTQRMAAESIRRAQESGTYFDTSNLRPGEFRRFAGRDGSGRGFAFRSADGQSGGFSFSSGGQGPGQGSGFFFTSGSEGDRVYRF